METKREITRVIGKEFCTVTISIDNRSESDEFSISGVHGRVVRPAAARKEALQGWISYFEDDANAIKEMNERCGTRFRSPTAAAKYVLANDGEFHGVDVVEETDKAVYIGDSFGQIREDIARFFPELVWTFKHHLNNMRAECVHQESRGETWATHPSAKCSDCGYVLGSAWTRRPLPPEIYAVVSGEGSPELTA